MKKQRDREMGYKPYKKSDPMSSALVLYNKPNTSRYVSARTSARTSYNVSNNLD